MKDIVMSIALVAAVVVPTYLLIRAGTKSTRVLKKSLIKLNKSLPAIHDIWSRRAMAINPEKKLTFVNLRSGQELVMDLHQAEAHLLVNEGNYTGGSIDSKNVKTVDLMISQPQMTNKLNIYDHREDDPTECGFCLGIGKKYHQLVLQAIGKRVKA